MSLLTLAKHARLTGPDQIIFVGSHLLNHFTGCFYINDLVFDQNIELNVRVESLKKEVEEKQQLLDETL